MEGLSRLYLIEHSHNGVSFTSLYIYIHVFLNLNEGQNLQSDELKANCVLYEYRDICQLYYMSIILFGENLRLNTQM